MIAALCISVVGLTLGFAAFSNVLTISSGATVSPDRSDFKLVAYGIEDTSVFDENFFAGDFFRYPNLYTSKSISKPCVRNDYQNSISTALDVKIESNEEETYIKE